MDNKYALEIMRQEMIKENTPTIIKSAFKASVEALEKQINKNLIDDGAFGICPMCCAEFNSELINEYDAKYCPSCGQKIDSL